MGCFDMGNKTKRVEPMMEDFQLKSGKVIGDLVAKFLPGYGPGQPYKGQMTAGLTEQEKASLAILSKMLTSPDTGELFGLGKQHISETLRGKYADPGKSPFIQSMQKLARKDLEKSIDVSRARRGGAGQFFTSKTLEEEGKLEESTLDKLNVLIGSFIEGERGRMLRSVPLATQMDEYETFTAPLKKITAGQTLGSLERIVQQAELERRYQDFIRQNREYQNLMGAGQNLFQTKVPYGFKDYEIPGSSKFDRTMGIAGQIAPFALAPFTGGASLAFAGQQGAGGLGSLGTLDWSKLFSQSGGGGGGFDYRSAPSWAMKYAR